MFANEPRNLESSRQPDDSGEGMQNSSVSQEHANQDKDPEPCCPEIQVGSDSPVSESAQESILAGRQGPRWVCLQEICQRGEFAPLKEGVLSLDREEVLQLLADLCTWRLQDQAQVVDLVIERGDVAGALAAEIEKLHGVDRPSVARKLMARGGDCAGAVALYPSNFQIDQREIIHALLNGGEHANQWLAFSINRFDPKYHLSTAVKLLLNENNGPLTLLMYVENFTGVDRRWLVELLDSVWPFRRQMKSELARRRNQLSVPSNSGQGPHTDMHHGAERDCERECQQACQRDCEHDITSSGQLLAQGFGIELLGCIEMFNPTVRWDIRRMVENEGVGVFAPQGEEDYRIERYLRSVLSFSRGQADYIVIEAAREMLSEGDEQSCNSLLDDFGVARSTFDLSIRQSMGLDLREATTEYRATDLESSVDLYRLLLDVRQESQRVADHVAQCEVDELAAKLVSAIEIVPEELRKPFIHGIVDELSYFGRDREVQGAGLVSTLDRSVQNNHVPASDGAASSTGSPDQAVPWEQSFVDDFLEGLLKRREFVDLSVIAQLIRAGYSHKILKNLESLSSFMPGQGFEICSMVAVGDIQRGYFGRASQVLQDSGMPMELFAGYLDRLIPQCVRGEEYSRILSIAAWVSLHSELRSLLDREQTMPFFGRYLGVFEIPQGESTRNASAEALSQWSADVEQMVRHGIPLLQTLGWLSPKHIDTLLDMVPLILKQGASSGAAWRAHRANLQDGKAFFLNSSTNVRDEINLLLSFHRAFPLLQVPLMYQAFHVPPPVGWYLGSVLETRTDNSGHSYMFRLSIMNWRTNEGESPHKPGSEQVTAVLRNLLQNRQRELLENDFHGERGLRDLQSELLAALIGSRDVQVVRKRVISLGDSIRANSVEPMDPRFQPRRFSVKRLDAEQLSAFRFSKDTQSTYSRFLRAFEDVRGRSVESIAQHGRKFALTLLLDKELKAERRKVDLVDDRARAALESDLTRIRGTVRALREARNSISILKALCDHGAFKRKVDPDIAPLVQRIALPFVLRNMPSAEQFIDTLEPNPSKAALEWIRELVNRNLVEEALGPMGLSEQQAKVAIKCFGITPFEDDTSRLASIGTRDSETLLAHPSRGVLGELSGFNCHACWTRKDNLMERYPNVTAIMFVRNPDDTERARLVGACMIIKARDVAGDEVFIIRGINPTQNFITNISAESFFESFVDDALVPLAEAHGVKKILIPADGLFEAQTNRPSLHWHINQRYASAPIVPLDRNGPETTFNDLEIWNTCVLVRRL